MKRQITLASTIALLLAVTPLFSASWWGTGQRTEVDFGKIRRGGFYKVPITYIKNGSLVARAQCSHSSTCRISIKVYKGSTRKASGVGKVVFKCDGSTSRKSMWYLILESPNCTHTCSVMVTDR